MFDSNSFEKKLNKLNGFYNSVKSDGLNNLEKDLLKKYIQDLYESLLSTESIHQTSSQPAQQKTKKVAAEPIVETIKEPVKVKVEEKVVATPPPVETKVVEVKESPKPTSPPKATHYQIPSDINEFFSQSTATELSEKLEMQPIKNLSKSFSINEKIFTIQELFDGNQSDFDETMRSLDGFNNLEEAKIYLSKKVFSKYNWLNEEKSKKVNVLLKKINRRYI